MANITTDAYQKKTWTANDIVTADDLNNIENGININIDEINGIKSDYLTKSEAATNYLTKSDGSATYLSKTEASTKYLTKTDASNNYLSKTDASNTYAKATSLSDSELKKTLLRLLYPVGSILMTANNNNPGNYIGGSWTAWGSGRVPVGVDSGQTEFNAAEKTGGEKSHTLTLSETPSHDHKGQSVLSKGGYTLPKEGDSSVMGVSIGNTYRYVEYRYETLNTGKGTPSNLVSNYINAEYGVPSNGGNGAHNNLQPYITCYMWKRTS